MTLVHSNVSIWVILIHSNVSKIFKKQHTNTLHCFANRRSLDGMYSCLLGCLCEFFRYFEQFPGNLHTVVMQLKNSESDGYKCCRSGHMS